MSRLFLFLLFLGWVSCFFEKFCCEELEADGPGAEASCGLRERFGGIRKFVIIFGIICLNFSEYILIVSYTIPLNIPFSPAAAVPVLQREFQFYKKQNHPPRN